MSYVSKIVKDLVSSVFDGSEFNVTPSKLFFGGVVVTILSSLAYYFRDYLPCCSLKSRKPVLLKTNNIDERYQLLSSNSHKKFYFDSEGVRFFIGIDRKAKKIENSEKKESKKVDYERIAGIVCGSDDDDEEIDSVDSDEDFSDEFSAISDDECSSDDPSSASAADEDFGDNSVYNDEYYIGETLLPQLENGKINEDELYSCYERALLNKDGIDSGEDKIVNNEFIRNNLLISLLFYRYLRIYLKKAAPDKMNTFSKLADEFTISLENGGNKYLDDVCLIKIHDLIVNQGGLNNTKFLDGLGMLLSHFSCCFRRTKRKNIDNKEFIENVRIFKNLSRLFTIWKKKGQYDNDNATKMQMQVIERIINFAKMLYNRGLTFSAGKNWHQANDDFINLGQRFFKNDLKEGSSDRYKFLEKLGKHTFNAFVTSEESSQRDHFLNVIKKNYIEGFVENFYNIHI